MPLYFAYGSNMAREGLRARCPASRIIGSAELAHHRFVLMAASGYASVAPDPAASVHGLLVDLAGTDVAALDAYEDVAGGLYLKVEREVRVGAGDARRALIYLGADAREGGRPPPGYMETVLAAARAAGLPSAYVETLAVHLPADTPAARSTAPRW